MVLQRMLANGLLQKRLQAELALTANRDNWGEIRQRLGIMTGNQARFRRLNDEGVERALAISRLRARGRKKEAEQLRAIHLREKLMATTLLVRSEIRRFAQSTGYELRSPYSK